MPDQPRRRLSRAKTPKWPLRGVYWAMIFSVIVLTIVFSLVFIRALFMFGVFNAPGPAVLLAVYTSVSLIAGAAFSQILVHSVTRPILEMSQAARRIAQGDFDVELVENTFATEIDEMADAFTAMAQELSATEMLRADFVSNVSHEIKTPIASIVGYATLLQRPELSDEQRLAYAGKIQGSARRLSSLTDDVLLLSRLEDQDSEPPFSLFNLSEQVREAILSFDVLWERDDRELRVELEEVECLGNEELLAHVWQNLIGNALKFTEPGDVISVSLRLVADDASAGEDEAPGAAGTPTGEGEPAEAAGTPGRGDGTPGRGGNVSGRGDEAPGRGGAHWPARRRRATGLERPTGHIEVRVADTGIGMAEEDRARVFEKFYQADRSHATEGNGLGLSLCKRIVDLHGGAIAAESEPGVGSTFIVTLPAPPSSC